MSSTLPPLSNKPNASPDGDDSSTSLSTPTSDTEAEFLESSSSTAFGQGTKDRFIPLKAIRRKGKQKQRLRTEPAHLLSDGDTDGAEDTVLFEQGRAMENENDKIRWSRDGGSPRSFRQMRERAKEKKRRKKEFFYSREEEVKVVRKFDKYLVGLLAVLYMLSFLDRSNIGNARIAGMAEDLNIDSDQYEGLLTAFYVTYIAFEWMTLFYKIFPAHKYVTFCVAGWGVVASIQALAWNWWSMVLFRALLGIAEAAFGPGEITKAVLLKAVIFMPFIGVPFYLSFFYRREELAFRIGLFISAAPLATAYAGSLAYLITSISSPLAPWRLLLIAEGFPTVVMAVVAWYWIPDSPSDARWLTAEERVIARRRLLEVRDDSSASGSESGGNEDGNRKVDFRHVLVALCDGKNWITALMFFSSNIAFSSLPVFLPTIIRDMGYSSTVAQGLSAPPYIFAFVVVILTSYLSDKYLVRSYFIIFHALVGAFGYAILATAGAESYRLKYAAVFLAAAGIFSVITVVIPWTVNNQDSASKRGTGMVLLNVIGQLGPLLGAHLYPSSDAPLYRRGMLICSFFMSFVAFLAFMLRRKLTQENKRMESAEIQEYSSVDEEEIEGKGQTGGKQGFRFIL